MVVNTSASVAPVVAVTIAAGSEGVAGAAKLNMAVVSQEKSNIQESMVSIAFLFGVVVTRGRVHLLWGVAVITELVRERI